MDTALLDRIGSKESEKNNHFGSERTFIIDQIKVLKSDKISKLK